MNYTEASVFEGENIYNLSFLKTWFLRMRLKKKKQ